MERLNRFVVRVLVGKQETNAFLHETGRLSELLQEGAPILLRKKERGRLPYEMVAVKREEYGWVLTHSLLHNKVFERIFRVEKREVMINSSRIDFIIGNKPFEVKGVTLFKGDTAYFPDAPTERGRKHIKELQKHCGNVVFSVASPLPNFVVPNWERDGKFSFEIVEGIKGCLNVFAIRLRVERDGVFLQGRAVFLSEDDEELKLLAHYLSHREVPLFLIRDGSSVLVGSIRDGKVVRYKIDERYELR